MESLWRLERMRQEFAKCPGFCFSARLKETFDPSGERPENSWTLPRRTVNEPIIRVSGKRRSTRRGRRRIIQGSRVDQARNQKELQETCDVNRAAEMAIDSTAEEKKKALIPLITTLQQMATAINSQSSQPQQERNETFKVLVRLTLKELELVCEAIDFATWPEMALVDLCITIENEKEEVTHPCTVQLCRSALYPRLADLLAPLSRLLMHGVLVVGKHAGRAVTEGIIAPLLDSKILGRPQMDVINRLLTNSLGPSARLLLLKEILTNYWTHPSEQDAQFWSALMQILGSLLSAQPLLTLDTTTAHTLVQLMRSVIESDRKNKECMQLLLILTGKHAQIIVEGNLLAAIEETALTSDMFLKRAVLGQVTTIKKKLGNA